MIATRTRRRPRRDSGFTLIEILVVIVIIGILIGLLLPAISGAVGRARNASVSAEITLLANALAAFKDKYGDYPPSRIVLREDGDYSSPPATLVPDPTRAAGDADLSMADLYQRSVASIRKFWPRYNFGHPVDLNQDGDFTDEFILNGSECLVFFLGGIRSSSGVGVVGFARNPRTPFLSDNPTAGAGNYSSTREAPFFEFRTDRLRDGGQGFYVYIDPLDTQPSEARPYAYFSSYGSNGYDPNDINFAGFDSSPDGSSGPISRAFRVTFRPKDDSGAPTNLVFSASPNPYTSSLPVPVGTTAVTYVNSNTYQIISAGRDRQYGLGGLYDGSSSTKLPSLVGDPSVQEVKVAGTLVDLTDTFRRVEADNLTNFSTGTLE